MLASQSPGVEPDPKFLMRLPSGVGDVGALAALPSAGHEP